MVQVDVSRGAAALSVERLVDAGVLAPIHQAFAETLGRIDSAAHPDVILAAAMVSEQLARGHVCLDLSALRSIAFQTDGRSQESIRFADWPRLDAWLETLSQSPLVHCRDVADPADDLQRPLVLDREHRRVYLARYWFYQQKLAEQIAVRLQAEPYAMDSHQLAADIARLFPDRQHPGTAAQCLAAAAAVDRRFSVITGGPGTGKTTTVARLLALRLEQAACRPVVDAAGPASQASAQALKPRRKRAGRTDTRQMLLLLPDDHPEPVESTDSAAATETAGRRVDADQPAAAGQPIAAGQPLAGEHPVDGHPVDEHPVDGRQTLRVMLMAPTGKAAQRLTESLRRAMQSLPVDAVVREALQAATPGTIHRMLGTTLIPPERGGPFRHHAGHPLPADVVLVDEASMVDLGLMWRLFDAVRPDAQIILLGDRDQLTSVEAGGVLSDLCGAAPADGQAVYSAARRRQLAERTGLGDLAPASRRANVLGGSVSTLRFSHRFDSESLLGQLAAAIRDGADDDVCGLLRTTSHASGNSPVVWLDALAGGRSSVVVEEILRRAVVGYQDYLDLLRAEPSGSPAVLNALASMRVLCAHREGARGEQALNRRIIERLVSAGRLRAWPTMAPGRAVMVTRNDYSLQLFNGDIGVVVNDPHGPGTVVLFDGDGAADSAGQPAGAGHGDRGSDCRRVPTALVPETQDCFAMTIHKSQGSEFHRVIVVLPDVISPVASRELIYTAVTRVCDHIDPATGQRTPGQLCIAASEPVLRAAVQHTIRRTSGLRDSIEAGLR